ncbi:MAG: hypothetical protein DHS20C06_17230 [Hyphobacterium sp.]|nr:MAG: hypothetical protein DHS20C06_17230 [Hyphobacterium sp.]
MTPESETLANNSGSVAETFGRLLAEATAPDEDASPLWQTYQREVYGDDAVIDW